MFKGSKHAFETVHFAKRTQVRIRKRQSGGPDTRRIILGALLKFMEVGRLGKSSTMAAPAQQCTRLQALYTAFLHTSEVLETRGAGDA